MHLILNYFFLIIISIYNAKCYTVDQTKALLSNITSGYNKGIRPRYNQLEPVMINIALEIMSIIEFDEVKEILSIVGFFHVSWTDEFLTWDPEEYGGISDLSIENDLLWKPSFILYNKANKIENFEKPWQKVRVLYTGDVFYYPADTISVTCNPDMTYYPFDCHVCFFNVTLWDDEETEVYLQPSEDKVLRRFYTENGAWDFSDSQTEEAIEEVISIRLILKRRPSFVIVNVIVPIALMTLLNTVVFFIPAESGERISYSITVVLAFAVFLTLVGENLPKTSSSMPYFSFYLISLLSTSICITVASIFSLQIYHKPESQHVTPFLYHITKYCMSTGSKVKNAENDKVLNIMAKGPPSTKMRSTDRNVSRRSEDLPWRSNENRNCQTDSNSDIKQNKDEDPVVKKNFATENPSAITWKDASIALDRIFISLSILSFAIETAVFFGKILS